MTKAKSGLGRGLSSLIPMEDIYDAGSPGFFMCPIEKIHSNPDQPRRTTDEESLKDLAASIKEKGILQPLVVRETNNGYEIIAGERRWRAAQLAGLTSVPVVIKDVTPQEVLEIALVENIQRLDLNPIEEALAYKRLIEEYGLTQSEVAKKVGRDRSTITNFLRLLKLPKHIQYDIIEGSISPGHARALLMLKDKSLMEVLRNKIKKSNLSVREAEKLAQKMNLNIKQSPAKHSKYIDPDIEAVANDLSQLLEAKVKIQIGKRFSKIEIKTKNQSHLEQIIEYIRNISK